jgi:hypothetical protein
MILALARIAYLNFLYFIKIIAEEWLIKLVVAHIIGSEFSA